MRIRIETSGDLLRALPGAMDLIAHWGVSEDGDCLVYLDLLPRRITANELCVLEFEPEEPDGAEAQA